MTTEAKQNTIIRHIVQTTDTKVLDQVLSLLGGKQQENAQNDWWKQITDYERDLLLRGTAQAAEEKPSPMLKSGSGSAKLLKNITH